MKKFFYPIMAFAIAAFTLTACEDVPAPYDVPTGAGDEEVVEGQYISETFATSFGDFTVHTVKGTPWVIDFSTAKASGYDNDAMATTPSESYLVSPAIDLSNSTGAHIEFDYILRYSTNYGTPDPTRQNRVLITDAYTGDPATTNWVDITETMTEGSDWNTFYEYSGNIDESFLGKSDVRIALYYSCEDQSATWEVKNLKVLEGLAEDSDDEPSEPAVGGEGDGTEASPYNVTAAIAKASASGVYVKGFIVGYVSGLSYDEGCVFSSDTCTAKTNVLIAASASETDRTKCMPVQLPFGDIRTGLNLSDNKANIGQEVVLYGNIENYFRVPGVKSVTYAKLGDKEIGTKPSQPVGGLLSESFASGQGQFQIVDIELGGMNFVWSHASSYSCMKASAYFNGENVPAESWLVSPAFSLAEVSNPILTFDNAVNYLYEDALDAHLQLLVSTDYDGTGNVAGATWTKVDFSPLPETNNKFTFVTSNASLAAFAGQPKVYIAFKYTSTSSCAPTWEVKNLSLADGGGSGEQPGGEEPGGDDQPGGEVSGNSIAVDVNSFGITSGEAIPTLNLTDGTTLSFADGGNRNAPAYYESYGGSFRFYPGNSMTITSTKDIESVTITCDQNGGTIYNASGDVSSTPGTVTVSDETITISGISSNSVVINNTSTTTGAPSQVRMKSIVITYAE